jgi:hypothetical protein
MCWNRILTEFFHGCREVNGLFFYQTITEFDQTNDCLKSSSYLSIMVKFEYLGGISKMRILCKARIPSKRRRDEERGDVFKQPIVSKLSMAPRSMRLACDRRT